MVGFVNGDWLHAGDPSEDGEDEGVALGGDEGEEEEFVHFFGMGVGEGRFGGERGER